MEKESLRRLRIHPAVFYRQYDNYLILYHTGQKKVFTFTETAGDILDCFHDFCTVEKAAEQLKQIYRVDSIEEFESNILEFICEMVEKDILQQEYKQIVHRNTLENEISRSLTGGSHLYSATLELTYKCNEKCRHCYVVGEKRQELTTGKIKAVLNELYDMNVFNLIFTGGEIFTRKDCFDILEYAYSKRFLMDIFTNGTLLDGMDYIRLRSCHPRCVHFSVYSHIPQKHDAVTQTPGSFEKTIKAIEACSIIGIPVNIKTPVFDETIDDIEGMVRLAETLSASIELGQNITPKKDGNLKPTALKISGEEKDNRVHYAIKNLIKTIGNETDKKQVSDKLCGAGDHSISINPYGQVYPCNLLQLCIGDVIRQPIREIWEKSDVLKWWRENNRRSRKKGCANCELIERCIFCPGEAMMRKGDPLEMYEDACLTTKYVVNREAGKGGKLNGTKVKSIY